MAFGLGGAPATFQRVMQTIFRNEVAGNSDHLPGRHHCFQSRHPHPPAAPRDGVPEAERTRTEDRSKEVSVLLPEGNVPGTCGVC